MFSGLGAAAHRGHALGQRSYYPDNKVVTGDFGGALSPVEMERYSNLAAIMEYDELVLLSNSQSNYPALYPPTGYVASIHEDAIFHSDAFIGFVPLPFGSPHAPPGHITYSAAWPGSRCTCRAT